MSEKKIKYSPDHTFFTSDTQYPEDTSYLVDVRSNGDGTYKYIAQFYNGGTWLNGVLEEGLNNLK